MNQVQELLQIIKERIADNTFIRLTLSKPKEKQSDLKKVLIKLIELKNVPHLSFVYRHTTKDITKNYSIEAGLELVQTLMHTQFLIANLFSSTVDIAFESYPNGKQKLRKKSPSKSDVPQRNHDKTKNHLVKQADYLTELGVTDERGRILKAKGDKFKQINKFIEIIAGLFQQNPVLTTFPNLKIVDMGAGKGYLTFGLYDFLVKKLQLKPSVLGIELRPDLVQKGNSIAQKVGFAGLQFEEGYISNYDLGEVQLLLALHACDTATDDAIFKGMQANAQIIICAPCCHKQIRRQIKSSTNLQPILNYGILKERQAEMVTDVIRALLLEANGYKTKVFEFISTEHTGKNIMIIGEKVKKQNDPKPYLEQVKQLKAEFGIEYHYLEKLLDARR